MSNTALIIVAIVVLVLVFVAVALLRRKPTAIGQPAPPESHGLADSAAAAVLDISTPLLGIDLNPDLPSDDLTRIKGLGPKAAAILNGIGIHRYAQLADLSPAQAGEVDARMGAFQGRILKDQWVDQARHLEQDDVAGFEAKYGKLG